MSDLTPWKRVRTVVTRSVIVFGCLATVLACSATDDDDYSEEDDGEDSFEDSSQSYLSAGACAGTALDRAVKCATGKGARILSYYRSPADQQRVRRENRCRNTCTGMSGCVRPTANCTSSPHTRCKAVDLVNDGYPVSRTQLRACGLAKTTLPHRNHYDLVSN